MKILNKPDSLKKSMLRAVISLAAAALFLVYGSGMMMCPAAWAETNAVEEDLFDPVGEDEGYSATLYDNTNGLPTSEVNAIAQDVEGFIWIGSYGGLVRYDGSSFTQVGITEGVTGVRCLHVDSKDRLWLGTTDNGAAFMEKEKFHFFDELRSITVYSICEDSSGMVYLATQEGIFMYDTNSDEEKSVRLDDSRITIIYTEELKLGADGCVYGLTADNDIFSLRDGKVFNFVKREDTGIENISCMMPDSLESGKIYIGTHEGVVAHGSLAKGFTADTLVNISPLVNLIRIDYVVDNVWLCASNGVGVLTEDKVKVPKHFPLDASVGHVMKDYQDNLWFTSDRQGVMKIVKNRFTDIYKHFDMPKKVVNATCMLDDKLFVATDSGLTVIGENGPEEKLLMDKKIRIHDKNEETDDLIKLLTDCRIRCIMRDSRDRLWFSTWCSYGLICYDKGKVTVYDEKSGLISDRLRGLCETSDGSVLVSLTGGVCVIKDGAVQKSFSTENGLKNCDMLTVAEGSDGEILLGSNGYGIYVIDRDGSVRNVGLEDGLMSKTIMRIKKDRKRDLYWIVSSNSLAYMTPDFKVKTIDRFPYSNNFDIYQNSSDEMWVLSSAGVFADSTERILGNSDINPIFYGISNGMPYISTANSYSFLTDDGELFIAGNKGVIRANIESIFQRDTDLKAVVPYIDADGERIFPDEKGVFRVTSRVKKLTIYSYVLNYSLSTLRVSYHLEGFEDTETTVERNALSPIDYTNLHGGEYTFVMNIKSPDSIINKTMNVKIVKERAFYEQLWFYIITGLIIIIIMIVGVRFYINAKLRMLEKKEKESMILVHEITEAFAKVIDMKDAYTNGHSTRVARYTAMLAKELGYDDETIEKYYHIALLHDIGKVGVPSEVLNKPGKLTDEEFEIVKSHASLGYGALEGISIMPELSLGAQSHHERPDGKGYPNHLKGNEIPRVAQIIAVADCFDAMYSNRPYRKRMNFEKAVSIIKEVSGTQLTPDVVDAFLRLVDKGEFRAPDDDGGGTTENIENIRSGASEPKP